MKDFDYYDAMNENDLPKYYGMEWRRKKLNEEFDRLDDTPMTKQGRVAARDRAIMELNKELDKLNKPYFDEIRRRGEEFWQDAREKLKYGMCFDEEAVERIEQEAKKRAEAGMGFQSKYLQLQEILEFYSFLEERRLTDDHARR